MFFGYHVSILYHIYGNCQNFFQLFMIYSPVKPSKGPVRAAFIAIFKSLQS